MTDDIGTDDINAAIAAAEATVEAIAKRESRPSIGEHPDGAEAIAAFSDAEKLAEQVVTRLRTGRALLTSAHSEGAKDFKPSTFVIGS